MKYCFVTLLAIVMMGVTSCTRIEPGWVGIKVNQAGTNKGVEDYPMQTGWIFYFPLTTRVYEYPTFQQNVIGALQQTKERHMMKVFHLTVKVVQPLQQTFQCLVFLLQKRYHTFL